MGLRRLFVSILISALFVGIFCVLVYQESEIFDLQNGQIDVEKLVTISDTE